jgi:hypothetical protein
MKITKDRFGNYCIRSNVTVSDILNLKCKYGKAIIFYNISEEVVTKYNQTVNDNKKDKQIRYQSNTIDNNKVYN